MRIAVVGTGLSGLPAVSFYYRFDRVGKRVEALLADVTNTPWNERHVYMHPHPAR